MSPDSTDSPSPQWSILYEMKAQLSAIQTSTNFVKEEQSAIRQRIHDLSNSLTPLMGLPDQFRDMKRDHEDLRRRFDSVASAAERVNKIEPVIADLTAAQNRGRGALWAAGIAGGIFGAIIDVVVQLGKALFR